MSDSPDSKSTAESEVEEISPREAEIRALGRDFSNYTYDGNFCVYFKLVHNRAEAESGIKEGTFFPDYVHQFFIDSERIFGYKRPVLQFFYSASRLKRYVKFDYEDKLNKEHDGIEPDNVMNYLSPVLEDHEYTRDLNQFITEVESKDEKDFRPPGELLKEFSSPYTKPQMLSRAQRENLAESGVAMTNGSQNSSIATNGSSKSQNGDASSSTLDGANAGDNTSATMTKRYQIFHTNAETKGFGQFQARMQSLVMWFIESATMIDYEDPRWDFFIIFEKYNPSTIDDPSAPAVSVEDQYFFAGYSTVYRYYAYPDRTRPRVSQMLLLPPYRRNGLGTQLLQSIYDFYIKQPATLDITAEDPDEEFISMRDYLDCRNCLQLASFQPDKLKAKWSEEVTKEAQDKLKMCQRQARKVYEILKLKHLDTSNEEEYRNYRLEIKNRLNIPNQRLKLDCDRVLKRGLQLPDDKVLRMPENPRVVSASLEVNYKELEKQYQHIIGKLNAPRPIV